MLTSVNTDVVEEEFRQNASSANRIITSEEGAESSRRLSPSKSGGKQTEGQETNDAGLDQDNEDTHALSSRRTRRRRRDAMPDPYNKIEPFRPSLCLL
jgi:hypothetical protein